MIWLTWRQFRASAVMTGAVLVALAAALAVSGPQLLKAYTTGLAACAPTGDCLRFADRFFDDYTTPFLAVTALVLALPALMGVFWGAPLITRELEAGTHLLVWNQTITRGRWLAVKLALIGLSAMAAAGVSSLAVSWWADPLDKSAQVGFARMVPLVFSARGIAPIGYAAFAFVLGVAVGMLVRRTLAAMAITLVLFAAVQVALPLLVRPHLMPAHTATLEISRTNIEHLAWSDDGVLRMAVDGQVATDPTAWVLSSNLREPSGHEVPGDSEAPVAKAAAAGACGQTQMTSSSGGDVGCFAELNRLGYRQIVTYHPSSRFWGFQWLEFGLYAVLTLALTWFSFWRIRRRLS